MERVLISGKSINKFSFQANEKMASYKMSRKDEVSVYYYETINRENIEKLRNESQLSIFDIDSFDKDFLLHAKAGNFSFGSSFQYNRLKRVSTLSYFSLYERVELERVMLQYFNGDDAFINLVNVYYDDDFDSCSHLLVPKTIEESFISVDTSLLSAVSKQVPITYAIKNILELPDSLYMIELLEQGCFQKIDSSSQAVLKDVLPCYDLVGYENCGIRVLEDENMQEVANTLDQQKQMLKTIRQSRPWQLK